jgi:hypothetical protein
VGTAAPGCPAERSSAAGFTFFSSRLVYMGNLIASVIAYTFLVALCFYVVRTWVRWFRSKVKLAEPRWRSVTTVCGFALTTSSLLVIVALALHALITGGLPYYHPFLLRVIRIGVLTALAGMGAGFIGTGQLENPTIAVSGLCLLIYFVEAMAQGGERLRHECVLPYLSNPVELRSTGQPRAAVPTWAVMLLRFPSTSRLCRSLPAWWCRPSRRRCWPVRATGGA